MSKKATRGQLRLGLLCGGVVVALVGWSLFSQGKKSVHDLDSWVEVEGVVLESEIEPVSMNNPSKTGPSTVAGWKPRIRYRYAFGGRDHENSRYTVMPYESLDYDQVSAIVQSYPAEAGLVVLVNPDDPSDSVISRSDKGPSWVHLIMGGLLMVIGAVLVGAAARLRSTAR